MAVHVFPPQHEPCKVMETVPAELKNQNMHDGDGCLTIVASCNKMCQDPKLWQTCFSIRQSVQLCQLWQWYFKYTEVTSGELEKAQFIHIIPLHNIQDYCSWVEGWFASGGHGRHIKVSIDVCVRTVAWTTCWTHLIALCGIYQNAIWWWRFLDRCTCI